MNAKSTYSSAKLDIVTNAQNPQHTVSPKLPHTHTFQGIQRINTVMDRRVARALSYVSSECCGVEFGFSRRTLSFLHFFPPQIVEVFQMELILIPTFNLGHFSICKMQWTTHDPGGRLDDLPRKHNLWKFSICSAFCAFIMMDQMRPIWIYDSCMRVIHL